VFAAQPRGVGEELHQFLGPAQAGQFVGVHAVEADPALLVELEAHHEAGLGEVVGSWIGKGDNLPVSADQLKEVLGSDLLGKLAGQLGMDPAQASGQLADMLPGLVDQLTPQGVAPENGLGNAGDLLGMLGGLLQQK